MDNKKNLSESEKEIMEFLWSKNTGASLKEIWEHFNEEVKKS